MPVLTALRLSTYLLVLDAVTALVLAGLVSLPTAALVGLVVVATWWRSRPLWLPVASGARRALLVVAVAAAAVDLLWLAGSAAEALVRWLLAALLARLILRGVGHDTRDVVAVAFVLLVAASSVSTGLPAMAVFVAFLVAAGWTLMLQHLVAEAETAGPRGAAVTARLGRSLWMLGAASSAATLGLGLALFFVIPRIGPAALLRPPGSRIMIGFADSVELGAIGQLESDSTIAMRARFPDGVPAAAEAELRWRGVVLDQFDGVRWTSSPGRRVPYGPVTPGAFRLGPEHPGAERVRQDITLEPLGTDVLFAAPRGVRVTVAADVVVADDAGAVTVPGMTGRVRYVVESELVPGAAAEPLTQAARARYLQLPPITGRIRALAAQITEGAGEPAHAAARLTAFLSEGDFRYTLALERRTALQPLDEFLFVRRAGNCEYFAASLAVMLRSQGIPARVVNGFQRGEWNPYGRYFLVRLADAHAWVEAHAGGRGWITLDPSPRARVGAAGPFAAFALYLDALRDRWLRSVADWGLTDQVAALGQIHRGADSVAAAWRRVPVVAAVVGVLGVGVVALVIARGRRRPPAPGARRLPRFYRQALRILARRGPRLSGAETAREFCQRVARELPACAMPLARLTDAYEQRRFGQVSASPVEQRALAARVAELRAAARGAGLTPVQRE